MSDISSNNKRIAKNTVMLYIRMLLSTVVSLYTSRVVLQTLGVEDYGIYGVVGGVVAMFSFLNSSMAGATSRFLTYEMGKGDKERLKDTFSSALVIHIGIALLVLILAETIGVWFLNNKLVIPEGRMEAAHWVLQLSVLGMIVGFTQVPYNATIIAHEKMDVYAYVELINVFLKLGIVYLLWIGNFDKLILYAFLVLVVNVIVAMIYRIYCLRHYEESKFKWVWNKEIVKSITSFSVYNLYGNMGWVVNNQGTNFLINAFFGVSLNAGASTALTISNTVNGFASNMMTAFRPQIYKSFAQNNYETFKELLQLSIKSILIVYCIIAIPVYISIDNILSIWLVEVPPYTAIFCRLMLISLFFEIFKQIIVMGIHACGKIKYVSIISGTLYCINPIIIYICFKFNCSPSFAYISNIVLNMLIISFNLMIMKKEISNIPISGYIWSNLLVIIAVVSTYTLMTPLCKFISGIKLLDIIIISIESIIILTTISYFIVLNKQQKHKLLSLIKEKLKF